MKNSTFLELSRQPIKNLCLLVNRKTTTVVMSITEGSEVKQLHPFRQSYLSNITCCTQFDTDTVPTLPAAPDKVTVLTLPVAPNLTKLLFQLHLIRQSYHSNVTSCTQFDKVVVPTLPVAPNLTKLLFQLHLIRQSYRSNVTSCTQSSTKLLFQHYLLHPIRQSYCSNVTTVSSQ